MIDKKLRFYSYNVNGLRACAKKGFGEWLKLSRADLVGVQELRAKPEPLDEEVRKPSRWHTHFVPAERPGYSGVALYSRQKPDEVDSSLGHDRFDSEGRLVFARFGELLVVNGYFPNGSGKDRDNSRVPYKLDFYRALFDKLETERARGGRILVMGDFNTAHEARDLARPKQNEQTSGFLPEEREELGRWLGHGWTDTFRHFEPGEGHYSWWSQRFGVRAKNIGWRIDYILASPGAMEYVRGARIHPQVMCSDHCPISVDLDPAIRA